MEYFLSFYILLSVSSNFLGSYPKFWPNFFKFFLVFLQFFFCISSKSFLKNFPNFSKYSLSFSYIYISLKYLLSLQKIFPFSKISLKFYLNLRILFFSFVLFHLTNFQKFSWVHSKLPYNFSKAWKSSKSSRNFRTILMLLTYIWYKFSAFEFKHKTQITFFEFIFNILIYLYYE